MKKILAMLLCFVISIQIPIIAYAKTDDDKDKKISAKAVCLMALDSGEVLYKENEYEELSPASVTKIMSILLVLEALDSGCSWSDGRRSVPFVGPAAFISLSYSREVTTSGD